MNDYENAVDPQTDNDNMQQEAAQRRQEKEYSLLIDVPAKRWKVIHRTPEAKDGCIEKVYFVRRTPFKLECSCRGYRFHRHCKHARYVANLIGQPALAE